MINYTELAIEDMKRFGLYLCLDKLTMLDDENADAYKAGIDQSIHLARTLDNLISM